MSEIEYLPESEIKATRQTDAPRRGQTRSGYGNRLPTTWEMQLSDRRWRRVYVICHSNSGTAYVLVRGRPQYLVSTIDLHVYLPQSG